MSLGVVVALCFVVHSVVLSYSLLPSGSDDSDPSDRSANSLEPREVFCCDNTAKLSSSKSDPYPIPNSWNSGPNKFPDFHTMIEIGQHGGIPFNHKPTHSETQSGVS
ncbi:uncharacterized protein P174DRAFT_435075 [Aspergillus novofumigatus IBT 16806]|uniref:Uncharacterized protein n=1 Tax=Aspergillus novofumigatus (strain IBT 16806) TaxID=1392255 RepID=A0A2I1BWG0_ASPN1|nr:uncharacterized protein P174DRAFT_435075 [Aspergillus novofumigatus IBT 16806]PKX89710.1 hypothetical protein P174DRAFT_435075 [Aspergillus novofumigatus IBT 16806]